MQSVVAGASFKLVGSGSSFALNGYTSSDCSGSSTTNGFPTLSASQCYNANANIFSGASAGFLAATATAGISVSQGTKIAIANSFDPAPGASDLVTTYYSSNSCSG